MNGRRANALLRVAVRQATTAAGSRLEAVVPGWRDSLTRGLTVFMFHEICATPSGFHREHATYTSPEVFCEQLSWIEERFTVIAPDSLPQLGSGEPLPENAALLTFDDAWAGLFRVGVPILEQRNVGAILFVNMATVGGEPDLGAVRAWERSNPHLDRTVPQGWLNGDEGSRVLERVRARYADDSEFLEYQGPTATPEDLDRAAESRSVWFGSHLYHHWAIPWIAPDLYERELLQNGEALAAYRNTLPVFATPNGYSGGGRTEPFAIPMKHGIRTIFIGRGNQNRSPDSPVLDRVFFPPEPASRHDWWYATHRRRILGRRTS